MGDAKDRILAETSEPESNRIVFARGGWSELVSHERQGEPRHDGRALPLLLRERWAIRSTIPGGGGTYFVLGRSGSPMSSDIEDPPSSKAVGFG
jgi:hypothetical protein